MTASADPTVHRLALWRRLVRIRNESGVSQRQLAETLGWPLRDLLLVEAVLDGVHDGRLLTLLDHHGIADDAQAHYQAVQALNRRDLPLSSEVRLLLGYERVATTIRTFEPLVIPGLLQTRAYAEAVLSLFAPPEDVGPLVEARLARHDLFDRDDAPEMTFLIDESALHRWAGTAGAGAEIMRGQLDHLRQMARNPRVRIQIVPYGAGLHEGVKGPFVILEFANPGQAGLLYLEDAKGDLVRADSADLGQHLERFGKLAGIAAPTHRLDDFLGRALADLGATPQP
jgi:hypothetical protein